MKACFFVFLSLVSGSVLAGPPALPGQAIYQRNCARCHGKDGRLGLNGAHNLTVSNLNAFGRTYIVSKGLDKMPAFEKVLTAGQIQQVVAYSLTLR